MAYYVYILASRPNGTIYIGSSGNLRQRVEQHQAGQVSGHTKKYNIKTLVYFEQHETINEARIREHKIKRWKREWKDRLIEEHNPEWRDVSSDIPL